MNRVVLITGASSGIGAAAARRFAEESRTELVLVARREPRLRDLAREIGGATVIPADLLDPEAPARIAETVEAAHGRLDVLVNSAGAGFRGTFADGGFAGVAQAMELNFNAVLRLTEALLPLVRRSAPAAIVNVASTAGRVARPGSGAYSASKFALCGWSEALYYEERLHGVHVGLVLPGFIRTEGFPARELIAHPLLRFAVGRDRTAAEAIADSALNRRVERYTPRPYGAMALMRVIAPPLVRRILRGSVGRSLATRTGADPESAAGR